MGDTVLVTGCSSGIGRATALRFRDVGWDVYATARDLEDVEELRERGCLTAELDVTDDLEVAAVVDRVLDERGRLDCLVNNAGYGQFGPVEDVPMEKVLRQFDVNAFGPLRLMQAALPGMRERGDGTIVNVTAGVGSLTLPGIGIYTASKFALESAIDALRQELSGTGVEVVTLEPGIVATDFYDRVLAELESLERTPAYDDLYRVLDDVGLVERGGPGINPPERVADAIVDAAVADRPDPVYRVGPSATVGTYLGSAVRGRVRDRASNAGVGLLSSDFAQRFLERADDADRGPGDAHRGLDDPDRGPGDAHRGLDDPVRGRRDRDGTPDSADRNRHDERK